MSDGKGSYQGRRLRYPPTRPAAAAQVVGAWMRLPTKHDVLLSHLVSQVLKFAPSDSSVRRWGRLRLAAEATDGEQEPAVPGEEAALQAMRELVRSVSAAEGSAPFLRVDADGAATPTPTVTTERGTAPDTRQPLTSPHRSGGFAGPRRAGRFGDKGPHAVRQFTRSQGK